MNYTFISDIDGTLIKTNLPLHQRVVDAAISFVDGGGRLTLSTGRDISSVEAIVNLLPINAPCILYGGGLIYDFSTRTILWKQVLNIEILDVLDIIYRIEESVSITIYNDTGIHMIRTNKIMRKHGVYEDRTAPFCRLSEIGGDILKVLLTCDDTAVLEGFRVNIICPNTFEYAASGKNFYEITPKGVNKGSSMIKLAELMNLPDNHFFAAGDAVTDLSMMKNAEMFFAPESAPENIREMADFVIPDPSDGGIVHAFEHILNYINKQKNR